MKGLSFALVASLETIRVSAIPSAAHHNNQICGKPDYDAGTESFWGSNVPSYAACAKACTKRKQCQSFAYGNGDCELYSCSVKSNFVPVSDSPYLFYDVACVASPTTSAVATKMTTTTNTTARSTSTTTKSMIKSSSSTTVTTLRSSTKIASSSSSTTSTSSSNDVICGQEGYMSGSGPFAAYAVTGNTTQEALTACYNYCITNMESYCSEWIFDSDAVDNYGNQNCFLSANPIEYFVAQGSTTRVWDRNCGAPSETS